MQNMGGVCEETFFLSVKYMRGDDEEMPINNVYLLFPLFNSQIISLLTG
jgi:hypothetical protein